MIRNRNARPRLTNPTGTTSSYDWKSDRADGFTEVQFVYDKEGKLIAVDYKLAVEGSETRPRPAH